MFKNYLTIALRHLRRHKVYTLINVSGLAIGIAFCLLTFLFVRNEWTYDRFHDKADRTFRLYRTDVKQNGVLEDPQPIRIPMAPLLKETFHEVEQFVRLTSRGEAHFDYEGHTVSGNFHWADPSLFEVFDFPLKWGDVNTALDDLNSVVLSSEMAQEMFEHENPIGKQLTLKAKDPEYFVVTGVLESVPSNSSLQFDFVASHKRDLTLYRASGYAGYVWNVFSLTSTYLLLSDASQRRVLESKFPSLATQVQTESGFKTTFSLHLQPLRDVHLNPHIRLGQNESNLHYSYILSGIAFLVLLIACINFVNLSIGQSGIRAREIGVRKVVGALSGQLLKQFWGEAIVLSFFALLIGIALAELFLPVFNMLLNQKLVLGLFGNISIWVFLLILTLFVGFAAGTVPGFMMSRFEAIVVMKGRFRLAGIGWVGRSLVVIQFVMSTFLVIITLTMHQQMNHIRDKDLGFDPEQIIEVKLWAFDSPERKRAFRDLATQHSGVLSASGIRGSFLNWPYRGALGKMPDGTQVKGWSLDVDYDFLETFGITLLEGRNFDKDRGTDLTSGMIISEETARVLGWEQPLGKKFPFRYSRRRGRNGNMGTTRDPEVIGVVKNFHNESLYRPLQPMVLLCMPGYEMLYVRFRSSNMSQVLSFLEKTWYDIEPNVLFLYSFLDEKIAAQYRDDERWGNIIRYSAGLAIFVACLGAFGLTALAIARRTKEIGIRKVLGASVASLLRLFSREFVWLVVAANVIAWPVAYYALDQWLQDFAYRIDLGVSGFLLGGVLTLAVVLFTVNLQALKAVRANPVDALRDE